MSKPFERILVVMFENQYRSYVIADPFMNKLASAGTDMTNYFGVFHPSQTNYVAALAGELCGVTTDVAPGSPLPQRTVVDLLEDAGLTWKAYMEGYPGQEWDPAWERPDYPATAQPISEAPPAPDLSRYFRKHNSFASFHRIQADETRWQKIVDDEQFWSDVLSGDLPDFGWFTPDIWNDGHYLHNTHIDAQPRTQLVPQLSTWLEHMFFGSVPAKKVRGAGPGDELLGLGLDIDLLLTDPDAAWKASLVPPGTLIVVTFDEADFDATGYDTSYDGPNQIYTVLLGPGVASGGTDHLAYNHYSLIKTVCRNYELGNLGKNDQDANSFRSLWHESFQWSPPEEVPVGPVGRATLTIDHESLRLVTSGADNAISSSVQGPQGWSAPESVGLQADGALAAATVGDTVHLVAVRGSSLMHLQHSDATGWSSATEVAETSGSIAMCSYDDPDDHVQRLMLCWQDDRGFISFRIFESGAWSDPDDVGQLSDGPMALAQLGPSVFLVYKQRRSTQIRMTSYNLAAFNQLSAVDFTGKRAPEADTSLRSWSPMDFPVGMFAQKFAALQNDYQLGGGLAMAAADGEIWLIHRGVYDDTPHAYAEAFGLTGVLTASTVATNGYGTLAQAGWSIEQPLSDVVLEPSSPIAAASAGAAIHLIWQPHGTATLMHATGQQRPERG